MGSVRVAGEAAVVVVTVASPRRRAVQVAVVAPSVSGRATQRKIDSSELTGRLHGCRGDASVVRWRTSPPRRRWGAGCSRTVATRLSGPQPVLPVGCSVVAEGLPVAAVPVSWPPNGDGG
ncbi:hypothetical protein ACPZ19_28270 [Amycolatopsis lurida]